MTRPPIRQPLRSNSRIGASESTVEGATAAARPTLPLSPVRVVAVALAAIAVTVVVAAAVVMAAVAVSLVGAAIAVRAFAVGRAVAVLDDAVLALVLGVAQAAAQ